MHILRWLFLHPIIFAWVLAILTILLSYRVGGDAKEDNHSAEATTAHEIDSKAHAGKTADSLAAPTADQAQSADHSKQATEQVAETVPVAAEAGLAETANDTHEPPGEDRDAAEAPVAPAAAVVTSQEQSVSVEAEADPVENTSIEDLLLAAREAYWSNDYERAAEFYQSLLKRDDHPSHKGELANVYWKQGKSQEAVILYAEIAEWLKQQGRMAELQNIKVYADLVDPAQGEAIGELLK